MATANKQKRSVTYTDTHTHTHSLTHTHTHAHTHTHTHSHTHTHTPTHPHTHTHTHTHSHTAVRAGGLSTTPRARPRSAFAVVRGLVRYFYCIPAGLGLQCLIADLIARIRFSHSSRNGRLGYLTYSVVIAHKCHFTLFHPLSPGHGRTATTQARRQAARW